jgi:cytochrome b561
MGDGSKTYGWVSIALHWIAAGFVIALFLLGQEIENAPSEQAEGAAVALHVSIGVIAWAFLFLRVVWRLAQGHPEQPAQHWTLNLLSYLVQYGLLLVIAIQIISGPLMIWTSGAPIGAFGWFEIVSPLPRNHELHEVFEKVHGLTANLVLPLIALHVLGALKHLIIDRDGVFQRMLWVRKAD